MPRRRIVLVLLAALAVAACTSDDDDDTLPPPTGSTSTSTTIDVTAVDLGRVEGVTTTTMEIAGGRAALGGTAAGPDGAAIGAVVRVERLVGEAVATLDVPVGADGTWRLDDVKGGRYRVRAWRTPDLVMKQAEVLFLGATEKKALPLVLERVGGVTATADVAPDPPLVGRPAQLAVLVATATVDSDGVVAGTPAPRALVHLVGAGRWRLGSENPATAGFDGVARWDLRCLEAGSQPLAARVETADGSRELPLELPDCVEPVAETTTTRGTTTTTSTTAPSSSSTTVRSTTTTTED